MKVKFLTLGCKVNQYETQALKEQFVSRGHKVTDGIADLYVVNTCTVTSSADRKSLRIIQKIKQLNPKAKVAVSGCLAQLNALAIKKLSVDYIVPQDRKSQLVDIVLDSKPSLKDIWSLSIKEFNLARAFVKIQDGCDNFCSFCKIPHLRGPSISRDFREVLREIKRLSRKHSEIVLCGINTGLYGKDLKPKRTLEDLVREILKSSCVGRLRLSSIEPSLVSDGLIFLFSDPKICPHMHLPFQSGDDRILKEMNKNESVALYEDIVRKLRIVTPAIAISCDIMVGFPSEDDSAFQNTYDFIKRVRPMRAHIFTFSPRESTSLSGIKIKNHRSVFERYTLLKKLTETLAYEYKMQFQGKCLNIIAEEEKNGYVVGYTDNYIKVWLKEKAQLGKMITVKIVSISKDKVLASRA